MTNRRSFRSKREEQGRRSDRRDKPSHLNVILSKAALSGPSVCLRARAPCPLRVSCPVTITLRARSSALRPGADRARAQPSCTFSRFLWLLGSRQVYSPDVQLTHGPGRTVALPVPTLTRISAAFSHAHHILRTRWPARITRFS
jgi:hypothetical protein